MAQESPNELFARTHDLLRRTFDGDGLKQLIRLKLGLRLSDLVSPEADRSAVVFGVVQWFEHRGQLRDLIQAATAERPLVAEWQALRSLAQAAPIDVFGETHQLLLKTFDREGLLKLGLHLFHRVVPEPDWSAVVFGVVQWFEHRGRLRDLIQAAAAERPFEAEWQALRSLVQAAPTDVFVETHKLLVKTFDRQGLQQMLRLKLREDLYAMASRTGDNTAVVFDVVEWFELRGRLRELIQAAAAERPNVTEWQTLLNIP
jgi:hypothetical protein